MKTFIVSALLLCQTTHASVLFFFQAKPYLVEQRTPVDEIEWELSSDGGLIKFDGYCETIKGTLYSTLTAPDVSGCAGVNGDRFYSEVRSALGVSVDRKKNSRRLKAILEEGFGDAVAPYQKSELIDEGIDVLRQRFLEGTETATCLDFDSNKLADIGITCRALTEAFKKAASVEFQFHYGSEVREGFYTDEIGPNEQYLPNANTMGLVKTQLYSFYQVTRTAPDQFTMSRLREDWTIANAVPKFSLEVGSYRCDTSVFECRLVSTDKAGLPKVLTLLEKGVMKVKEERLPTSFTRLLLPINPGTSVVYKYRFGEVKGGNRPPNVIKPSGPNEEIFWYPGHTYAIGLGDIYWASYSVARRYELPQLFGSSHE